MAEEEGPGVRVPPLKMCARFVFFFFGDIDGGSAIVAGDCEYRAPVLRVSRVLHDRQVRPRP